MNILTQNDTKSSSDFKTRKAVVNAIVNLGWSYNKACGYYHTSRSSAHRWVKKYNGNPCEESLALQSHKPHTLPPNTYSEENVNKILNIRKRSPEKTTFEIWMQLKTSKDDFKPCYMTVLRVLSRNNAIKKYVTNKKKKHNNPYDTPTEVGIKWQVDVKYVPSECKTLDLKDEKFYQYTVLDEHSRKRFLYYTNEHSMYETVKAIAAAIKFFQYIPIEVQTDNGFEFTDKARKKESNTKLSYLDAFLARNGIIHHLIRPRTPEHNGKVERSHRIDQEKFYRNLKFYSLDDLKEQGKTWMNKYNNMPRFVLNFKSPNEVEFDSLERIGHNLEEIRRKCVTSFVN